MNRFTASLLLTLVPPTAEIAIRLLYRSMKVDTLGWELLQESIEREQSVIYAFWHDQLLMMAMVYRGNRDLRTLISASKDGELIARTIGRFGFQAVRGSSSRRGGEALKEMLRLVRAGSSLVITPDGPKGPRHRLKPGVVQLALRSGRPVVPIAFVCSRGYRFSSWDRFLLPLPFSRGVYSFGEPVYNQPAESFEAFTIRLQTAMDNVQCSAATRLEEYGLSAV